MSEPKPAEKPTPHCCFEPCGADADWSVVWGARGDDYTHACTGHVGALMATDASNTVAPIGLFDDMP